MPEVTCPRCQARLDAPEHLLGTQVTCSQCGTVFVARHGPGVPMPVATLPYPPQVQRTSGQAVAALVLGIASIALCTCYGIPAIICGIVGIIFSRHAVRAVAKGQAGGSSLGMAKAGKICSIAGIALGAVYIIFIICYFAFAFLLVTRVQPTTTAPGLPSP